MPPPGGRVPDILHRRRHSGAEHEVKAEIFEHHLAADDEYHRRKTRQSSHKIEMAGVEIPNTVSNAADQKRAHKPERDGILYAAIDQQQRQEMKQAPETQAPGLRLSSPTVLPAR